MLLLVPSFDLYPKELISEKNKSDMKFYAGIACTAAALGCLFGGLRLAIHGPKSCIVKKDVPGAIKKIGAMGYKFVEPAGYANGKFYGVTPLEFKSLCKANKMNILSSHTGQNAPDAANRRVLTKQQELSILFSHRWMEVLIKVLPD